MRLVERAKYAIGEVLQAGDFAIDATAGNGHDTVFLAESVGRHGLVYSFDVQESALNATRKRLMARDLLIQTRLFQCGHQHLGQVLQSRHWLAPKAVMFNLGYLPGASKQITTTEQSTLIALRTAIEQIAPGGRITVIGYTGHSGGTAETEACKQLAIALRKICSITLAIPKNTTSSPPELIIIERKQTGSGPPRID